jgi:TPR repeat protein
MNENPTNADEQYELGHYYEEKVNQYFQTFRPNGKPLPGAGGPAMDECFQNDKKAFYWYTQAAKQGHAKAQYEVGHAYIVGGFMCCKANKRKARDWLTKAAEQGNEDAKKRLATLDSDYKR